MCKMEENCWLRANLLQQKKKRGRLAMDVSSGQIFLTKKKKEKPSHFPPSTIPYPSCPPKGTLHLQILKYAIFPATSSLLPTKKTVHLVKTATHPLETGSRDAETLPYTQSRLMKSQSANMNSPSVTNETWKPKGHELLQWADTEVQTTGQPE